ncbi:hypothetical protein BDV96DRAFT_639671 [Lophiotrema nucula]|uniref:F-box domain-containing protein n=1 Tax=Lophiotrema nucula TaxID=690887 RepID=A0A6A5ZVX5_9PLEO|nr:hypothetical protein BDV96DRAFT_639671 [Lophiotrema nucula]
MSSILSLSDDVLYTIVSNFERDLTSLRTVAQVCQRFHAASRSLIFRHIPDLKWAERQLLRRSLAETPKLQQYVHSWLPVSLHHDGTITDNQLEEALAFPNLRHLAIQRTKGLPERKKEEFWVLGTSGFFRKGRDEMDDFHCYFLDGGAEGWNNIRSACLDSAGSFYFSSTEIVRFMLLPSIKSLKVSGLAQLRAPHLPPELSNAKSGLEELQLRGRMPWSCETTVVHELLLPCSGLKRLVLQLPMVTICYTTPGIVMYTVCDVLKPVAPANLEAMLEPVRESLQELTLLEQNNDATYDGSVMDFSSFTELLHLEVPAPCVLGHGTSLDGRESLYEKLPSSLQSLHLEFPRDTGILYDNSEQDEFRDVSAGEIPLSRYQWLRQFSVHKVTHLSRLTKLSMRDPIASTRQGHWVPQPLTLPSDLLQLFHHSDIALDIRVSYPNPGSPIHRHSWSGCTGRSYGSIQEEICKRPGCEGRRDAEEGKEPWDEVKEMMEMYEFWEEHEDELKYGSEQLTSRIAESFEQ